MTQKLPRKRPRTRERTRILYWNIQDFAQNKIADPRTSRQPGSSLSRAAASLQRDTYIREHIEQAQPNVFVVVEVETGFDANGRLVRGAGMNASLTLLRNIRELFNDDWMLVPPLQTGPNEGVAVYFDSATLAFSGPFRWSGGQEGCSVVPGGAVGRYALAEVLPATNVPAGALYNVGNPQNTCAAQTVFNYAAGTPHLAGRQAPFIRQRSPYMTTFAQLGDNGQVERNLTLFSIHAPAADAPAKDYLRNLANLEEIVNEPDDDEVRVVLGDFNVNLMDGDLREEPAYRNLQARGYALALKPLARAPGNPRGYMGYFATHMRPRGNAAWWSKRGRPSFYPGYRYVSGRFRGTLVYAIDNIFTRYGDPDEEPDENKFTILNGIASSPYDLHEEPVAHTPVGSVLFDSGVTGMPFGDPPEVAPPFAPGMNTAFQAWDRYGHIRSTSDHMALVIDV